MGIFIMEIGKVVIHMAQDNDIYKELSKKYGEVTVKSAIFDTQISAMKLKIENILVIGDLGCLCN